MAISRKFLLWLIFGGLLGLASAVLLELTLVIIRRSPSVADFSPFRVLAANLYHVDRNIIQYMPECAMGDPELSYTLRPGRCVFSNLEFSTPVEVNHLGLRDDESSLDGPDIVVVGDSYAMGWGVQQQESFASGLEARTGRKVLDAGIASYGTARELTLLKRIDLSRTGILIIQYCSNDFRENETFIKQGYRLERRPNDWFAVRVNQYRSGTRYWLGRYSRLGLKMLKHRWNTPPSADTVDAEAAPDTTSEGQRHEMQVLVEVLAHSPVDLSGVKITLFEFATHFRRRPEMVPLLRQVIAESPDRERLANVTVVDIMERLAPDDFYPVDGHLNASGHAKVADVLARLLR